jgi:hypothetical protein
MRKSTTQQSAKPASLPDVDLIFVLAGREARKACALQLFHEERAPRILLSVGRFEIRKFRNLPLPIPVDLLKLALTVAPPLRHFFVCFEDGKATIERISIGRFGTLSEMRALVTWLGRCPKVRRILMVSSRVHLPRLRLCCWALLPSQLCAEFFAAPDSAMDMQPVPGLRRLSHWGLVLGEAVKVPVYAALLYWMKLRRRHEKDS